MTFVDFIFISLVFWQVILGCYILLIWVSKNFKFQKSPNLNIGEVVKTSIVEETKVKKNMGPIEVDVKSNVIMDTKSDESSVKLDEKVDKIDDKEADMDFKDLPDKDIDNDGDEDESDEYLHHKLGNVAKRTEGIGGVVGIPALGDFVKGK